MEKQNVTLSLSKNVLRKAKLLAVRRGASLSGLLVEALTQLVEREDAYMEAQRRHLACLDQASDMGTLGHVPTTRETLHERS
jgi:hypothetical protein